MNRLTVFLCWGLALMTTATACDEFDFKDLALVTELRVLGVAAEPPEIGPGQGAAVNVLWADPLGQGRTVSFAWVICGGRINPAHGLGYCDSVLPPKVASAAEGGATYEIPQVPPKLFESLVTNDNVAKMTAVIVMCGGGQLPTAQNLLEEVKTVDDLNKLCRGGDPVIATKTFSLSTNQTPNTNPAIAEVHVLNPEHQESIALTEGEPVAVTCSPDEASCNLEVELTLTEDSFESYPLIPGTEPIPERLYISWFVDQGSMAPRRTMVINSSESVRAVWDAEDAAAATMWVVAHDTRGGTSWKKFQFLLGMQGNALP